MYSTCILCENVLNKLPLKVSASVTSRRVFYSTQSLLRGTKASLFELPMLRGRGEREGGEGGGRGEREGGGGGGGRGRGEREGRGRTHSVGGHQHSCLWRGVHILSQNGLLDLHTTHTHNAEIAHIIHRIHCTCTHTHVYCT